MDWYHEVDLEWLEARRLVITATEIISLLPEYKRHKKSGGSGAIPPLFAALWCEKRAESYPDVASYKAAARGHILEPYAIEAYNKQEQGFNFYHWDDVLITRNGIGFSPDGMDFPCPAGPVLDLDLHPLPANLGKSLSEVKSYEPRQHVQKLLKATSDVEERLQLAVAFYVIESLEYGVLVFYCPNLNDVGLGMFLKDYSRSDLEEEVALVGEIVALWKETCKRMAEIPKQMNTFYSEAQIYEDFINARGSLLS